MKTKMGKYLCEFAPDNPRATKEGYVYTHVLVAEKKLGRYLTPEECVHHVDHDKYNNDPSNLMIFKTIADHTAFHQGVPAIQDGDVWWCPTKGIGLVCPMCFGIKDRKAPMCRQCYNKQQALLKTEERLSMRANGNVALIQQEINSIDKTTGMPRREILKEQIRNNSFSSVGKMYGVTDNTVRKWCEKYGLPKLTNAIKFIPDDEWENENISIETKNIIDAYYSCVSSDIEIVDAYLSNPRISVIAEQFHKNQSAIKKILSDNNIRILNAYESGNIKITEQYTQDGNKVGSFITVMDAAKWILNNGYGRNNHKAKKIAYLISKNLNTGKTIFGFLWTTNDEITNYKEYLLSDCTPKNELSDAC